MPPEHLCEVMSEAKGEAASDSLRTVDTQVIYKVYWRPGNIKSRNIPVFPLIWEGVRIKINTYSFIVSIMRANLRRQENLLKSQFW